MTYSKHCMLYDVLSRLKLLIMGFSSYGGNISLEFTLYTVHYTLYVMHCKLYWVQCTIVIVLYFIQCPLDNVHGINNNGCSCNADHSTIKSSPLLLLHAVTAILLHALCVYEPRLVI